MPRQAVRHKAANSGKLTNCSFFFFLRAQSGSETRHPALSTMSQQPVSLSVRCSLETFVPSEIY